MVEKNADKISTNLKKILTGKQSPRRGDVNITGAFFVLREAMARVADNGVIINMSTSVNRVSIPAYGPYGATKSAIDHLTKVASKEVGRGIRVNAVSPGQVNTELFRKGKSPETIARLAAMNPFNRS